MKERARRLAFTSPLRALPYASDRRFSMAKTRRISRLRLAGYEQVHGRGAVESALDQDRIASEANASSRYRTTVSSITGNPDTSSACGDKS
jgi:hypothetical protein